MTFTVIVIGAETFSVDFETLEDLASFANEYALADSFVVDLKAMTITIG